MEIENLWSSVKTFYFRNENVILRVPFCFFLQLGTYFDKIVKESREEDTKTWYETAGTRPSSWSLKISSHTGKKTQFVSFWLNLCIFFFCPSNFELLGVAGDVLMQKCKKKIDVI